MPLIAILLALFSASMSVGVIVFGAIAGHAGLLWFADLPVVGVSASWAIQATGIMQFGDGILGNLLCFALLLVLISFFVGLATWVLLVIEQLTDALTKKTNRIRKHI